MDGGDRPDGATQDRLRRRPRKRWRAADVDCDVRSMLELERLHGAARGSRRSGVSSGDFLGVVAVKALATLDA